MLREGLPSRVSAAPYCSPPGEIPRSTPVSSGSQPGLPGLGGGGRARGREQYAAPTPISHPQEVVYRATTKGLIEGVISGYNATVFAYGPTGKS